MYKFYALLLTFFTVYGTLSAQHKVTVGQPYKTIDASGKHYFYDNGKILTLKTVKRSVILQSLNASTLEFEKTQTYKDFPRYYTVELITALKNRYYIFYSFWEKDKKQVYTREIDIAGCALKSPKKLITVDERITSEFIRAETLPSEVEKKYKFFFAHDSSTMVVLYRFEPKRNADHKNFDVIGMHVFSSELTEK